MSVNQQKGLPRNPRVRFHFTHPTFDFFFQWMCGATQTGCTEIGELFYAASQVKDYDPESWFAEFAALAERVEARAQTSLAGGHMVSARESFLRAYSYYRCAPAFFNPRSDPRYLSYYLKGRDCFRKAAALFEPPIEMVSVPFEGKMLPGYFVKVDSVAKPHKTLLMIGGGDTFVEDLYGYIVPQALRRGYNVLFVDLPGQGALPYEGLTMRFDTEEPMRAVVDYALSRPEIDPQSLVSYGISGGGYLLTRAVTAEKRIKAFAVCSVILDFTKIWSQKLLRLDTSLLFKIWSAVEPKRFSATLNLVDTYRWRWGAANNQELMAVSQDFKIDPSLITCPMLNIVAEQEYTHFEAEQIWAKECLEKVQNSKKDLIITPQNEGADSHAVGTNLSLMSQLVFDWFDDVLKDHLR